MKRPGAHAQVNSEPEVGRQAALQTGSNYSVIPHWSAECRPISAQRNRLKHYISAPLLGSRPEVVGKRQTSKDA